MPTYDLGDGVPLELEVLDATNALTDATVSLAITRPDGTTFTPPSITHVSTGIYRATAVPDAVGVNWAGVWATSGTIVSVKPFWFSVADPAPPPYADLATVKSMLGKSTDDDRDDLVNQAILSASRMIEKRCGRRFYADKTATTRTYRASERTTNVDLDQVLRVDDIATATGVTVATGQTGVSGGSYIPVTTFDLGPFNSPVLNLPFTEVRAPVGWLLAYQLVQVTAKWGWPMVPNEIGQATALLASRLYRRKDSPQGVLGNSEWGIARVSRTDPDVEALIAPYIVPVIV